MKFNFPMAWSIGGVAMGLIEQKAGHLKTGELEYGLKMVKWGYDYLVNSYISESKIVMSIGAAFKFDFPYMGPPELYEVYVKQRPVWYMTPDPKNRSSETAGEVAACLAMGSIIFKNIDSEYSDKLLNYAKKYYAFGKLYEGSYQDGSGDGFAEIKQLYPSNTYFDEMAWGALWIYIADSNAVEYLEDARDWYDRYQTEVSNCGWAFSWEEKGPALHILLSKYDKDDASVNRKYHEAAQCYFNQWLPGELRTVPHTPRGLAYRAPWGSTRYAANTAYLAMLYAKYLNQEGLASTLDYQAKLVEYGKSQIDYLMGANGKSFIAGFGTLYPMYLLHKASYNSYIFFPQRGLSLTQVSKEFMDSKYPQIHTPYGAMVGGPIRVDGKPSDFFIDKRQQYQYVEPAMDYNACLTAALAFLSERNPITPISDDQLDLGKDFVPPILN
jgi:hypothetical protein